MKSKGDTMTSVNDPHSLVSFSHALLESRYNYNAAEQRLVLLASALVEPNDSGSDYYTIDLKAIKNQYSFGESFYQEMENACESIMKNPVYLKEDHNTKLIVHWFSSMEIDRINKTVTVSFHDLIKPQLFDLKEKFLVFLKSNAVSLTYPSYIRIFLLIKAQEFLGHGGRFYKEMSIDQIKEICVISQDTPFFDLKRQTIEKLVAAINQLTDIDIFDVEYIKQAGSKKVVSVKFHAQPKKQMLVDYALPKKGRKPTEARSAQVYEHLLGMSFTDAEIRKLIREYGVKRIDRAIAYMNAIKKRSAIKNPKSYLVGCIKNDYSTIKQNAEKEALAQLAQKQAEQQSEEDALTAKAAENRAILEQAKKIFKSLSTEEKTAVYDAMERTEGMNRFLKATIEKMRIGIEDTDTNATLIVPFRLAMQQLGYI